MSESVYEKDDRRAPVLGEVPRVVAGQDAVETLREQVGELVVAHPGVLRLEPTLLGALQGLRQRSSLDGIQLDVHGRVVDLDVNVAIRAGHQARASLIDLRRPGLVTRPD
ncbi:MAG: hypothetical protein EOP01_02365, partial [Propionibacteriaceae bacterium]